MINPKVLYSINSIYFVMLKFFKLLKLKTYIFKIFIHFRKIQYQKEL